MSQISWPQSPNDVSNQSNKCPQLLTSCNRPPCHPLSPFVNTPTQVAWIKSDSKAILALHTHMVAVNSRLSVTHNGHNTWKLHISHVQLNDSGSYMCQINTDPMRSQVRTFYIDSHPPSTRIGHTHPPPQLNGMACRLLHYVVSMTMMTMVNSNVGEWVNEDVWTEGKCRANRRSQWPFKCVTLSRLTCHHHHPLGH